jgi:hypothetical protein
LVRAIRNLQKNKNHRLGFHVKTTFIFAAYFQEPAKNPTQISSSNQYSLIACVNDNRLYNLFSCCCPHLLGIHYCRQTLVIRNSYILYMDRNSCIHIFRVATGFGGFGGGNRRVLFPGTGQGAGLVSHATHSLV